MIAMSDVLVEVVRHGRCVGVSEPLWDDLLDKTDPGNKEDPAERQRRLQRGKTHCLACPVRAQCLELALLLREADLPVDGIWGGEHFEPMRVRSAIRTRAQAISR